jgi:hypothetical protein
MLEETKGLKTIWYLVGIVIFIMGVLVILAGFIDVFGTSPPETVLADLHPGIWWGAIFLGSGRIPLYEKIALLS